VTNTHQRNGGKRTLYKQKAVEKDALSVTVTPGAVESPAKRYETLAPWIELANWAPAIWVPGGPLPGKLIPWIESQVQTPSFPRDWLLVLAKLPAPDTGDPQPLLRLVQDVFLTLARLTPGGGSMPDGTKGMVRSSVAYEVRISDGLVRMTPRAPFASFVAAMEGVEANRIRRCPICQSIFYAVRATSQTCSFECNRTRRVRKYRAKQVQYELNRERNEQARQQRETKAWLKPRSR
jgi:hypothetical protein